MVVREVVVPEVRDWVLRRVTAQPAASRPPAAAFPHPLNVYRTSALEAKARLVTLGCISTRVQQPPDTVTAPKCYPPKAPSRLRSTLSEAQTLRDDHGAASALRAPI